MTAVHAAAKRKAARAAGLGSSQDPPDAGENQAKKAGGRKSLDPELLGLSRESREHQKYMARCGDILKERGWEVAGWTRGRERASDVCGEQG